MSANKKIARRRSLASMTARRGKRSTTTPPNGSRSKFGTSSAMLAAAVAVADPVKATTCQIKPTR